MAERKDPNAPVQLTEGGPLISPGVTDPRALGYAAGVAARRAGPAPAKYQAPVGGGPMPPIPRLDQEHRAGMTMADQASAQRLPTPGGGIFKPQVATSTPPTPMIQPPAMPNPVQNILPTDMLPHQAKDDPAFQPGVGGMVAMSQPGLALKYGVIRGGNFIPPQMLVSGKIGSQQEQERKQRMMENLAAITELNRQRAAAENPLRSEDARVEQEVAAGPAGASVRPNTDRLLDDVATMRPKDNLDFSRLKEMQQKDLLNNEDQRKIIEERLQPMGLAELILQERIRQRVPIQPGTLEVEFESMTWEDEITIKRTIVEEAKSLEFNDQYLLDRYSMMALTAGLYGINGQLLPAHRTQEGFFDKDMFWVKFDRIKKLPFHMIALLSINQFWFEIRVRKLFVTERLKNG